MRRFYDAVSVLEAEAAPGGAAAWHVMLDQRTYKTPKGTLLELPTRSLAEAVRDEWAGQGEHLKPLEMPITTLACTAVDLVRPEMEKCVDRMLPFLQTDTLCFEDAQSSQFRARQTAEWAPLRAWFDGHFKVKLGLSQGIMAPAHPEGTLEEVGRQLRLRNHWEITAIEVATQYAKSFVVATALCEREDFTIEQALQAAMLEEIFQIERWGMVEGDHDVSHADILTWFGAVRSFSLKLRASGAE